MGRVSDFFREQNIALAQQQRAKMVALDTEFEALESKVKILDAENLHLRAEVNPLKREIERLKNQVEKKSAPHDLEQTEIEMLKFVGNKKSATASEIVTGMNMHSVTVEHFLGRLLKSNYLLQAPSVMGIGAIYSLTDQGNAYLVENKLVPLTGQAEQPSNPKGHHCDHCGGVKLRRTGNRPDPTFAAVGVKQALYSCLSCGKESAFTNDES